LFNCLAGVLVWGFRSFFRPLWQTHFSSMQKRHSLLLLFLALFYGIANAQNKVPTIDTQRFGAKELLWDLKKLGATPSFSWLDPTSTVRSLTYESVAYNGKPTQVFAYYSNPDLLTGKQTGRKFPGIVLIHGGGGAAFKQWAEKWAADGYAAIAMDLGGKGADGNFLPDAGPDQTHEAKFTAIENGDLHNVWSNHAVASVILAHSWLLNRPEVQPNKTALTGISWGGYLTCLVASLDDRFKAAVPVYGCGYYDESDIFGEDIGKLSPEARQQWMRYFDPSSYLTYACVPLLFVNGNKDRFYNVVPYYKTYNLAQKTEKNICYQPDMVHGHLQGWQPIEIRYFVDSKLNGGAPLPKIGEIKKKDMSVSTSYNAVVGLRSARFYHSSDTTSTNEKRAWASVEAKVDPARKTLTAELPEADFTYGFFYVTDHREVSASSPIWVKREL
ncbi:alpha/beta hydrolase family protein, partial [Persicitalea sp.]|uniref:alpha/beta hydrolase family protein n=1 Tax=Persicitalea sp. TaxID=3100273 RepID=UPI003593D360